ncbi:hypothetical protein KDL45_08335, partial [bacterium]|nr:hypothetical protein [bacterium]
VHATYYRFNWMKDIDECNHNWCVSEGFRYAVRKQGTWATSWGPGHFLFDDSESKAAVLALNSEDQIYAAYHHAGNIYVAKYDGKDWIEGLAALNSALSFDEIDFAFDENDEPRIVDSRSHYTQPMHLKYVYAEDGYWFSQDLETGEYSPGEKAMVLLPGGRVQIIASYGTEYGLVSYTSTPHAADWEQAEIEFLAVSRAGAVVRDGEGNAFLFYTGGSSHDSTTANMVTWNGRIIDRQNLSSTLIGRSGERIAVDSTGQMHSAYAQSFAPGFSYSMYDGENWSTEFVEIPGATGMRDYFGLRIKADDFPQIVGVGGMERLLDGMHLIAGEYDGTQWHFEALSPAYFSIVQNLVLLGDSNDKGHVVYRSSEDDALLYISNAAGPWSSAVEETIKPGEDVDDFDSPFDAAIDGNDVIHVAACERGELYYHVRKNGEWETTLIPVPLDWNCPSNSPLVQILVDDEGFAMILTYFSRLRDSSVLRAVSNRSGEWEMKALDDLGRPASHLGAAIDPETEQIYLLYESERAIYLLVTK